MCTLECPCVNGGGHILKGRAGCHQRVGGSVPFPKNIIAQVTMLSSCVDFHQRSLKECCFCTQIKSVLASNTFHSLLNFGARAALMNNLVSEYTLNIILFPDGEFLVLLDENQLKCVNSLCPMSR